MHDLLNVKVYQTASVAGESTGDKARWAPTHPLRILRWGYQNLDDAIIDVGTQFKVALDWRPTVKSDTNRAEIDTISTGTTDVPQGEGRFSDLVGGFSGSSTGSDGSTVYQAPSNDDQSAPDGFKVYPGEELVFEVLDAADTDADEIQFFVEYVDLPWSLGRSATAPRFTKVNS